MDSAFMPPRSHASLAQLSQLDLPGTLSANALVARLRAWLLPGLRARRRPARSWVHDRPQSPAGRTEISSTHWRRAGRRSRLDLEPMRCDGAWVRVSSILEGVCQLGAQLKRVALLLQCECVIMQGRHPSCRWRSGVRRCRLAPTACFLRAAQNADDGPRQSTETRSVAANPAPDWCAISP